MLTLHPQGLYCPTGHFYIDPSRGVENAIITHAHSDHARRGSKQYYCANSGVDLLKVRLGNKINVRGLAFGEIVHFGDTQISLHPAGHILGSSQVRIERNGQVWVASGDYKREPDPTCEPFQPVKCDVFVTEATFGTPSFRWEKSANLGREIFEWWRQNAEEGFASLLFAYSLGKAQRILGVLEPYAEKPVLCDPSVTTLNACYRAQGVALAPTECLSVVERTRSLAGELLLVPQSFLNSGRAPQLGKRYRTAFASGWMARDSGQYDHGFTMSDHADWDDLVRTIQESGAREVYVQHRGKGALVRHLHGLGIAAYPESDLANPPAPRSEQLALF